MEKGAAYHKGKSSLVGRFAHAFRGIGYGWQKEPNFRIEVLAAAFVIVLMAVLPLTSIERAILVITIFLVLGVELINSVLERVLDLAHPEFSSEVKRIKDTMAGIVLLAAATSVTVAGLILLRPLVTFVAKLINN